MDIQKIEDSLGLSFQGQSPQQTQMMAMPEVGAPAANPLMMIWRRKGILLGVVAACVLGALIWYMFSTQIFRSESRLFVQTGGAKAPLDVGSNNGGGGTGQGNLHTQCELIKSASILASVLASPELANLKTFEDGQRWTKLKENLNATVGKDNDIITVSFDSPYPREAQTILKSVVEAYASFHTKEKRSRVSELEKWRNKTQLELEKKQKELLEFKKANHTVSFTAGEKGNLTQQKLASLQTALTQAHLDTINARSAYDSAKAKLNDPAQVHNFVEYLRSTGATIGSDSNEQALRGQLLAMEAQSRELEGRYLPNHPARRAAEATVASLRARIGEMDRTLAETYLLAMEQKVAASKNRETELQQSYEEQNPPGTPITPDRNAMLFQGLMIGLVRGCFAALVRDWTDQGRRSSEEIIEPLGVPLLGSVPHMPGPPNPMSQGRKVDFEPASDVAETYRTIRTAVFFGTPDRESRTILVTSPAPGDGKTTFPSNLAIPVAQTGNPVRQVD